MPDKVVAKNSKTTTDKLTTGPNALRRIRISEGLKSTELAKMAGVSAKTLSRMEEGKGNVAVEMKHRVVKALNNYPGRTQSYIFKDVFLNDPEW